MRIERREHSLKSVIPNTGEQLQQRPAGQPVVSAHRQLATNSLRLAGGPHLRIESRPVQGEVQVFGMRLPLLQPESALQLRFQLRRKAELFKSTAEIDRPRTEKQEGNPPPGGAFCRGNLFLVSSDRRAFRGLVPFRRTSDAVRGKELQQLPEFNPRRRKTDRNRSIHLKPIHPALPGEIRQQMLRPAKFQLKIPHRPLPRRALKHGKQTPVEGKFFPLRRQPAGTLHRTRRPKRFKMILRTYLKPSGKLRLLDKYRRKQVQKLFVEVAELPLSPVPPFLKIKCAGALQPERGPGGADRNWPS